MIVSRGGDSALSGSGSAIPTSVFSSTTKLVAFSIAKHHFNQRERKLYIRNKYAHWLWRPNDWSSSAGAAHNVIRN